MQVQDDTGRESELDLRHYLRVVARRKWLIVAVAVLVGLASMGYAFTKDDRYRATGDMLLLAPGQIEATAEGISDDPDRIVANEIAILQSLEMREAVEARLGPDAISVDATASGDSDVITLRAESTVPEEAADAVNAYARTYERLRRQRTVAALRVEVQNLEQQRRDLQQTLSEIDQPLNDIDLQIQATPPGPELDGLVAQRNAIEESTTPAREATQAQMAQVEHDIQNTRNAMRSPTGGVNYLNPAGVPAEPVYPQPKKDLIVGLMVGLLLGLAAAFVWEQLDDAVRGRADADRATGGLAVLGLVPKVSGWRDASESRLVTRDDPHSGGAEAYRSLVTSIEFLTHTSASKVVLVTSPGASEGKTTTVANTGMALAEAGHHTVIVDGDLRRPRVHRFFQLDNTVGFTTVLAERIDIATAIVRAEGQDLLEIVPAGPPAPNPAELLRSEITEAAIQKLAESFDVVLIDSPPVLPVADALVLARYVDAAVLVAAADSTSRRKLTRAVEALRQVDAPLRGLVLNGVSAGEGHEYGYYGEDGGETRRREGRRRKRRRG